MLYYLVSPEEYSDVTPRPFFWMKDGGDRWVHFVRGKWPFKNVMDIIAEIVKADDVTELDWSRVPLYDNDSSSGWLSREGRFYGCPANFHDRFVAYVLGMKVHKMEKLGWTRVLDSSSYSAARPLSHEQKSWLSCNGFRLYKDI